MLNATYNEFFKSLKCQLTESLRCDRKQCWIGKCRKVEKTAVVVDNSNPYRLIVNIGPYKPSVSDVIKISDH